VWWCRTASRFFRANFESTVRGDERDVKVSPLRCFSDLENDKEVCFQISACIAPVAGTESAKVGDQGITPPEVLQPLQEVLFEVKLAV